MGVVLHCRVVLLAHLDAAAEDAGIEHSQELWEGRDRRGRKGEEGE